MMIWGGREKLSIEGVRLSTIPGTFRVESFVNRVRIFVEAFRCAGKTSLAYP